jgi:hypothetical protein
MDNLSIICMHVPSLNLLSSYRVGILFLNKDVSPDENNILTLINDLFTIPKTL